MGRLAHLRHTAPLIIESGAVRYCLVDFSCPDRSGEWLKAAYPDATRDGSLCIVDCPGESTFHKTRAQNSGAWRAIEAGAKWLCFADADTLFRTESFTRIRELALPGRFLIAPRALNGKSIRSLTGLLVVASRDFERSGGYDEAFVGWGGEDVAMRLKLHLSAGLTPVELPPGLVHGIPHSDWLRARFCVDRDLISNARKNDALLHQLVERWTGHGTAELPPSARELLFHP
jgi:hypothetical protein